MKAKDYHPEASGVVERRHKKISMLCRLHDCEPRAVTEMWHIGLNGVCHAKETGELVLR